MKAENATGAKELNDTEDIQAPPNAADGSAPGSMNTESDWDEEDFKLEIRKIELQQGLRKLQKEKRDTEQA
jgi:hypothetical protein